MSVFADTSSLYAAMVRTEAGHSESLAVFEDLLNSGRAIQTTNYVVLETVALLQHRIGLDPSEILRSRSFPSLRSVGFPKISMTGGLGA